MTTGLKKTTGVSTHAIQALKVGGAPTITTTATIKSYSLKYCPML